MWPLGSKSLGEICTFSDIVKCVFSWGEKHYPPPNYKATAPIVLRYNQARQSLTLMFSHACKLWWLLLLVGEIRRNTLFTKYRNTVWRCKKYDKQGAPWGRSRPILRQSVTHFRKNQFFSRPPARGVAKIGLGWLPPPSPLYCKNLKKLHYKNYGYAANPFSDKIR